MSKSLIRKTQLHPDISDLVGEYGSGYFLSLDVSGELVNNLSEVISGDFENTVRITGNQTISGEKIFATKVGIGEAINEFGFVNSDNGLQIENYNNSKLIIGGIGTDALKTISFYDDGVERFKIFHDAGGTNFPSEEVILSGKIVNFTERPVVNGTGVLLSGEAVPPLVNIENITTNFNFTKNHNSKLLKVSGDQNIITGTLPLGLDTGYNVSFVQMGTKEVCITGVNGITIEQKSNFNKTDGKYSIASLIHHGNNQYLLYGDLA
jgi:hypothetical protein